MIFRARHDVWYEKANYEKIPNSFSEAWVEFAIIKTQLTDFTLCNFAKLTLTQEFLMLNLTSVGVKHPKQLEYFP